MMNFNAWALHRAIQQEATMTDDYNLACSENLRYEVNRQRAKDGLPPLPTYTPPADTGQRQRKSDAKVSDPVNKKHSHYFKPVAHLAEIDVYRICDLYCDDRSGATQHAVKKLLLPGERGAGKSRAKDYQEAIDTLTRKLAMLKEDEAA